MNFSSLKKIKVDGVELVKLAINGVLAWKGGHTNLVPLSTEADGVTIYNGGKGYKDGYRVRSVGVEAIQGIATCTGFIKATDGDVIRLSGYDAQCVSVANAINVFDGNRNNLGQIVGNAPNSYGCFNSTGNNWDDVIAEGNGVYYWIVPSGYGIEYIRVTGHTYEQGSKMIVTVNEEIA